MSVLEPYLRRPVALFGWALAVFLPLNLVRWALNAAAFYPVALLLTLVGHLLLVVIYGRWRGQLGVRPLGGGVVALAVGVVASVGLQVPLGLLVELVVGRSALGITVGGFVPAVLLGPAFALVIVGYVIAARGPLARGRHDVTSPPP